MPVSHMTKNVALDNLSPGSLAKFGPAVKFSFDAPQMISLVTKKLLTQDIVLLFWLWFVQKSKLGTGNK
jgi:hypothetical protein